MRGYCRRVESAQLDRYCYEATTDSVQQPIRGLTAPEHWDCQAWAVVQIRMKTHTMDVSLRDEGSDRLIAGGTSDPEMLSTQVAAARQEVEVRAPQVVSPHELHIEGTDRMPPLLQCSAH